MVIVKTDREIELMKQAGKVLANMFRDITPLMVRGTSTAKLNEWIDNYITENGCIAAEKGYCGYPASACISVNDTLIHGIPSERIILKDGDIVSLDVVTTYKGYSADACRTYKIGQVSATAETLVEVTKQSFFEAVKLVKPGARIGDIAHCIQTFIESHGYNVVREFTGHGIGAHMHEDPVIPNYGKAGTGVELKKGMALCIEPMVLQGRKDIRCLPDGWTIKSKDGKLTCHYENTVMVTDDGYEIITMYEGEN